MTRRIVEVLVITDEDGTTDWQVDPEHKQRAHIVHVDYREVKTMFPDEIEDLARSVQALSPDIPWRKGVLAALKEHHAQVRGANI